MEWDPVCWGSTSGFHGAIAWHIRQGSALGKQPSYPLEHLSPGNTLKHLSPGTHIGTPISRFTHWNTYLQIYLLEHLSPGIHIRPISRYTHWNTYLQVYTLEQLSPGMHLPELSFAGQDTSFGSVPYFSPFFFYTKNNFHKKLQLAIKKKIWAIFPILNLHTLLILVYIKFSFQLIVIKLTN